MAIWNSIDEIVAIFERQFEPDGDGFLYRLNERAAPIAVSSGERDTFVQAYRRGAWLLMAATAIGTVGMIVALALLLPDTDSKLPIYGTVGLLIATFVIGNRWIYRAPSRALAGRQAVGASRDRAEMRQRHWSATSYKSILVSGGGLLVFGGLQFLDGRRHEPLLGGVMIGLAIPILLYSLYAKYRHDLTDRDLTDRTPPPPRP